MGYCIAQMPSRFAIKQDQKAQALYTLSTLFIVHAQGGIGFSFVNMAGAIQAKTLEEALACCRYRALHDKHDNITALMFEGEKLGSDFEIFKILAPFVTADSFLEFRGEDGDHWRWAFDGRQCHEIRPQLLWPSLVTGPVVEGSAQEVVEPPLLSN